MKKKDNTLRICIDYRILNTVTIKNRYPLLQIDKLLERVSKATYFLKIDLANGYYQIQVAAGNEEKTAFRTYYEYY